MKLFNTLSNHIEELQPSSTDHFTVYCCGPTVYNYAHIGNFRTYALQDVLIRTLETDGYNPYLVRNITDVDDKTIKNSIHEGVSLKSFTNKWTEIFHADCEKLNIKQPNVEPRATDHISEQISLIQSLLDGGFAYVSPDNCVYFRISQFKSYGALSNVNNRQLVTQSTNSSGEHNIADEYDRENVADFALWKARKKEDGENFWPSPWGEGRPGWHIECSAMAKKYLGDTVDLHSGGVDLKFPHHENEIAQSECANHHQFVRYWMHIAHLLVDGSKMSKSLGNLFTVNDILNKNYSAEDLRYSLIAAHYSQQLNFTINNLDAAKNALTKLQNFYKNFPDFPIQPYKIPNWKYLGNAWDALMYDLNTPACLGNLFKFIGTYKNELAQQNGKMAQEFCTIMYCLGLQLNTPSEAAVPADIEELAKKRWAAKIDKNFLEADHIREILRNQGWGVKDSPNGYSMVKL